MQRMQARRLDHGDLLSQRIPILTGHLFYCAGNGSQQKSKSLEGSTVDNCIKLWFSVRFQKNKNTEARFYALQYHYSFPNST